MGNGKVNLSYFSYSVNDLLSVKTLQHWSKQKNKLTEYYNSNKFDITMYILLWR